MVGSRRNCRGGRYEANIYSKTYTEGSDPFELRLVSDLWSAAHDGSPFPRMDRTVYNYITVAAKNAKDAKI
jgi:hypothetical protein